MEELLNEMNVDLSSIPMKEVSKGNKSATKKKEKTITTKKVVEDTDDDQLINCLRNERVVVRHINKNRMGITNPKHIMYGGMLENATKVYTVPKLKSGGFVNVLTNEEKDLLEDVMGLKEKITFGVMLMKKVFQEFF